jgi:flagella basal body P-ring formation protein FlgA
LFASLILGTVLAVSPAAGADAAVQTVPTEVVSKAIARAVRSRLGKGVSVSVWEITGVRLSGEPAQIVAVPDPSARLGEPARFVLSSYAGGRRSTRVGEATATVRAVGPTVRTTRAIRRGEHLAPEDLAVVPSDWNGRPLRPLPSLEDAIGARALHNLAMNAILTDADIAAEPLVRAGDIVRAHAHIGLVDITGRLVAAENGLAGEVIRVVNQETRHKLRARVIGSGEVEVVNVR